MSSRHLPAGHNITGGGGGGVAPAAAAVATTGVGAAATVATPTTSGSAVAPGVDLVPGPAMGARRRQSQYMPQYHHQHMGPMYPNYIPYGPQQYYGMPPHLQNGGLPSGYMPYPGYARSPPSIHQYAPLMGVNVPPAYPRQSQQSPSLATPYQPPPALTPALSQTPSSTHSSQIPPPPTPPTPQTSEQPSVSSCPDEFPAGERIPFRPPLPWLSRPDLSFPTRTQRSKRRRRPLHSESQAVSLPILPADQHSTALNPVDTTADATAAVASSPRKVELTNESSAETSTRPQLSLPLATSKSPSANITSAHPVAAADDHPKDLNVASGPVPSNISDPILPGKDSDGGSKLVVNGSAPSPVKDTAEADVSNANTGLASPPTKTAPTSWANLFAKPAVKKAAPPSGSDGSFAGTPTASGVHLSEVPGSATGSAKSNGNSPAEVIRSYQVGSGEEIAFLEPRGLINTGNMCYMNSVLQVLMFCVPFYNFLDQIGKKAIYRFKSETPLIDAMVMFMHEFKVLSSAASAEQLRRNVKSDVLERYGEPFTPDFVYEAIRQLSRFASMRRGHQQDAEEFLGFLLQSLDDECTQVMHGSSNVSAGPAAGQAPSSGPADGWMEVGRGQRPAVTRSSAPSSSTPISRMFGGLLRSELRVPGLKDSITTEPYQPLQLDIGSPDVRNVVDALRGLTRPERLQGDFNSPRGKDVMATKQVSIESLPPVLILHLKRFQFDAKGHGTVKIWKRVGYPLELEIPREALSRQKRQALGDGAMPKYKLISVVYHHGKNASGGHYTVDVRRQDGQEWIRMDDTVLRRVRSEDVAACGSEEGIKDNYKENSATSASGNKSKSTSGDDSGDEDGWKQVTASAGSGKRWSSVVNGSGNSAGAKEKHVKESVKDNKVAYLLFYQRE